MNVQNRYECGSELARKEKLSSIYLDLLFELANDNCQTSGSSEHMQDIKSKAKRQTGKYAG